MRAAGRLGVTIQALHVAMAMVVELAGGKPAPWNIRLAVIRQSMRPHDPRTIHLLVATAAAVRTVEEQPFRSLHLPIDPVELIFPERLNKPFAWKWPNIFGRKLLPHNLWMLLNKIQIAIAHDGPNQTRFLARSRMRQRFFREDRRRLLQSLILPFSRHRKSQRMASLAVVVVPDRQHVAPGL